jgi:hypothetical protein
MDRMRKQLQNTSLVDKNRVENEYERGEEKMS